jgi:hypothetical protein
MLPCHVVVEIAIPANREVHSSVETVFVGGHYGSPEPTDHDMHEVFHACVT